MLNGKAMIILLTVGFTKKTLYKWYKLYSINLTGYKSRTNNVKVEISLSNYATKEDLKNITHVDTSSYALKQI